MRPGMSRLAGKLAAALLKALGLQRQAEAPPAAVTGSSTAPQSKLPEAELRLIESVAVALRDAVDTLRGFSELLARGEGPRRGSEAAETASRFILEGSEDLNRFLANLQDFVRLEQGRLRLAEQQADPAELVEAALSACRTAVERADVTILARLAEGLELHCDPVRISNAIADMVLWAAYMAPAGSKIGLTLSGLPEAGVALSVTATVELHERGAVEGLFEPDPAAHGLRGFSLPVARRVALLHSGDLTAEHGPGGQTTLHLVLPAHRILPPIAADACESRAA
jgi:K+-sensing histidine kinase KdpD